MAFDNMNLGGGSPPYSFQQNIAGARIVTRTFTAAELIAGGSYLLISGEAGKIVVPVRAVANISRGNTGVYLVNQNFLFEWSGMTPNPLGTLNVSLGGAGLNNRKSVVLGPQNTDVGYNPVGVNDLRGRNVIGRFDVNGGASTATDCAMSVTVWYEVLASPGG